MKHQVYFRNAPGGLDASLLHKVALDNNFIEQLELEHPRVFAAAGQNNFILVMEVGPAEEPLTETRNRRIIAVANREEQLRVLAEYQNYLINGAIRDKRLYRYQVGTRGIEPMRAAGGIPSLINLDKLPAGRFPDVFYAETSDAAATKFAFAPLHPNTLYGPLRMLDAIKRVSVK